MGEREKSAGRPTASDLARVLDVYEVRTEGETLVYLGRPSVGVETLKQEAQPLFHKQGYDVRLQKVAGSGGQFAREPIALVAEPHEERQAIPWRNVVLFVLTLASTLFAGAFYWYQLPVFADPLSALEAWPFAAAIMGVLGVHEYGHYVMSQYHDVDASLPYFIPLPLFIGSMGAVIRMRERMPSRKALFDIGAAGPLAGLVATVVVTAIGLQLDPLPVQKTAAASGSAAIHFNDPPLLVLIAELTGTADKLEAGLVHPVVFGGWVGMLVTLLNLLPVGQLDGGHILRAIFGKRQETLAAAVPGALFALAGYLLFVRSGFDSVGIWGMWGIFTLGLAYAGPADPIDDEPLDSKRVAVGVLTLVLGALCFTPIPVEVVQP
jgi:membrane-associated protease RseP (regulator of RpoE activity)